MSASPRNAFQWAATVGSAGLAAPAVGMYNDARDASASKRKGEIEQEQAQKAALARASNQMELSEQAINKANQKAPDIGALLLAATKKKKSPTDLTGGATLGGTSLLGDVGEVAP